MPNVGAEIPTAWTRGRDASYKRVDAVKRSGFHGEVWMVRKMLMVTALSLIALTSSLSVESAEARWWGGGGWGCCGWHAGWGWGGGWGGRRW
jgi:hypothetical protein